MTSDNKPPQGFETKSVPGYVPAVVPAGGDPVTEGIVPGFSNSPGPGATPTEDGGTESGGDTKTTPAKTASTKTTGTKS
jgi:hypothetical protein